jgi:ABC-2 type transport system permease protein
MSVAPVAPPAAWAELQPAPAWWQLFPNRLLTFCLLELRKIAHDRTELYTRAIQPVLWLLIFGETFSHLRVIPTGRLPYLDYLAPGIMAQSALFVAIFYGIQIIWERDFGILAKLLATPTPPAALVAGKAFAASIRATTQVIVILALSALLGVHLNWNPVNLIGTWLAVVLGSAFFSTLSMTIAGIVRTRERLMGIGQAITMPLFFASNALYPVSVMPGWLRAVSLINPLSYEVDALRSLLLGVSANLAVDFAVLLAAVVLGIIAASLFLRRLTT